MLIYGVALRKESVDRNNIRHTTSTRPSVALRKESVDRNLNAMQIVVVIVVALRKESVDRNSIASASFRACTMVALRKESVDRNCELPSKAGEFLMSLSARRAWIEISKIWYCGTSIGLSLSARRAWIEILFFCTLLL